MTPTTAEIFDKFEVRKTGKQKKAFRQWALKTGEAMGYEARLEKCSFGGRNIVFGDIEKAKVIFTAHYDTCPVLPFPNFITPKSVLLYIVYQLLVVVGIFIPVTLVSVLAAVLGAAYLAPIIVYVLAIVMLALLMFGPANRHTANDNTSGVTTVFDTMAKLPPELRGKAAFVLFDYEELGLIGSNDFNSKHRKPLKNIPVVNFDCVSDGRDFLFVFRRKSRGFKELMEKAFAPAEGYSCEFLTKGYIYPSDQASFPCGIGAASFKKKWGIHYMNRIHTPKDTVYDEKNISFLSDSAVKLTEML